MEEERGEEEVAEHFEAGVVCHDGDGGDALTAVVFVDGVDVVQEEEVGRVALELLLRHYAAGHAQVRLVAPQVAQQQPDGTARA